MNTSTLNPADFAQFVLFIAKYGHQSAEVIANIARDFNTPEEVLDVIMGLNEYDFGKAHMELIHRMPTSLDSESFGIIEARLAKLATFSSDKIRNAVAINSTNPETLALLANDELVPIRTQVARNRNTSRETIEILSHDMNDNVRNEAMKNRNREANK